MQGNIEEEAGDYRHTSNQETMGVLNQYELDDRFWLSCGLVSAAVKRD